MTSSAEAVDEVARTAYGQLLAYLASRYGDVASAEDALGDAFLAALRQWPADGIPDNPRAWILRAAQRKQVDAYRRKRTREMAAEELERAALEAEQAADDLTFPDERLKLLFVCAHPAIDPAARAPLSLQTVLGIQADRIASAFLVSPAAMSQRLVRAKAKIRDARIPFYVPGENEWPERFESVLDSLYAAFTTGWDEAAGSGGPGGGLAMESIWLGRLLVHLLPDSPEALGLLALMLHSHARHPARRSNEGAFVPLPEQDVRRWSAPLIAEAEALIRRAAQHQQLGRYQIEAAIQSVHAQRAVTGKIEWGVIAMLYDALIQKTPAIGARIGRALAQSELHGPSTGLQLLDVLPASMVRDHQPYWATRAHLLTRLGSRDAAAIAYKRALGLTEDPAVRTFLSQRLIHLKKE
ncbi:RNA polymerase sigma-70 factor (ECF subfamily) [Prosthecobacter fusiformis]|uniref:RNA polymerase sigma-70 factor (ECF subfamily) n=1 Tax=Prosthecobacter fusiformis TaxID=48464 RepID=A0A4R7SQL6_9BACT|nr:DUF6596 domain-containing protein [Prosthecobacter fusiformis]TDU80706.1 RNA polymerase sigma-70 factor (ECF subfamily) [Prosthecobacter fusiformis]